MIREELIFVATCDISGHVRGKGFPACELPARLEKGVGWTGSNLMMAPQGPIWDTPFGAAGDLTIHSRCMICGADAVTGDEPFVGVSALSALKPARPLLLTAHALLQAKLAVGTKPDKLQGRRVRLAVNQNKVGPNMAIAVIVPLAAKRVIKIAEW